MSSFMPARLASASFSPRRKLATHLPASATGSFVSGPGGSGGRSGSFGIEMRTMVVVRVVDQEYKIDFAVCGKIEDERCKKVGKVEREVGQIWVDRCQPDLT